MKNNILAVLKSFTKPLNYLVLVLMFTFASYAVPVYAATQSQRDDAYKAAEWDDQESDDSCVPSLSSASSSNASSPGKLFILGDSIGVGVSSSLPTYLKTGDGWSISSDAVQSRRLDQAIPIAQAQPQALKDAQYILIILGTNPSPKNTVEGIQELVSVIKLANSNAPIFWLSTNVTDPALTNGAVSFNSFLRVSNNITMIENTIAPGSDGVHYSDYGPLAELIANSITNNSSTNNSTAPDNAACCAQDSYTELIGGNNTEIIWNFFIGKGLSDVQVAGIMGNLQQEGNFNPNAVNKSSGAYGIAQWLGGRLRALEALASSTGREKSDLGLQLEFLWSELEGSYYRPTVLDPILASSNLEEVTRIFLEHFEIPCAGAGAATCFDNEMAVRLPLAQAWLDRAGGGGGGSNDSSSCSSSIKADKPDIDTTKVQTFTGPLIDPTGIVLHWTGSDANRTVDQFIEDIKSNKACGDAGCSVQFYIDGSGKIYQLVDPINTKTAHAAGANECCIGIEIGGRGADDLLGNGEQMQSVVNLSAYLVDMFDMQIEPDVPSLKGILSHHITPKGVENGKTDVGDVYHQLIVSAVKSSAEKAVKEGV